jgi:tetratricopeptide (TPR) repeat protein
VSPGEHRAGPAARGVAVAVALLLVAGCQAIGPPRPAAPALTAEEQNDLGVARAARGDWTGAREAFDAALRVRPGWALALRNLGDAHLAAGDLESALAAYEAARRAAPGDAAIENNLAWALLQHPARWPEAEPLIVAALARDPEPRAYFLDTLGVLRIRQRAYDAAWRALQEALADPALVGAARAQVRGHAAQALEGLGDAPRAARCRAGTAHTEIGVKDSLC